MKVLNCLCAGLSMVALSAWMIPSAHAQLTGLYIEPVITHDGPVGSSDLSGLTTYRLYGMLTSPEDVISAVYGNDDAPLGISTTTDFWQSPIGSVKFATSLNPLLISVAPELAYDSWFTIGLDVQPSASNPGEAVTSIGMTDELGLFEAGNDFYVNSAIGASFYALPGAVNGIAGDDLEVLLGQFTTNGQLSGTFNIQVFIGGNQLDEQLATFSFESGVLGCTDAGACNFDAAAEMDNGTCTFPDPGLDCEGNCLADSDQDGICDADEIAGCQDASACNYNADATDPSTCVFADDACEICVGDQVVLQDADGDNICDADEIAGCQDATACNYNAAATDPGACNFADDACEICAGDQVVLQDADGDGVCDADEIAGCQVAGACNFDAAATDSDDSCVFADGPCEVCAGDQVVLQDADGDGVCDADEVVGCTDTDACNYSADATDEDGSCTFAEPLYDCAGDCLNDADGDGVCDELEIAGCTDPQAMNYDEAATDDNGSCVVDGSGFCGYGTTWDAASSSCVWDEVTGAGSSCEADFTDDGVISIADLLAWLPYYGLSCE